MTEEEFKAIEKTVRDHHEVITRSPRKKSDPSLVPCACGLYYGGPAGLPACASLASLRALRSGEKAAAALDAVVIAEREACAQTVDRLSYGMTTLGAAIRARTATGRETADALRDAAVAEARQLLAESRPQEVLSLLRGSPVGEVLTLLFEYLLADQKSAMAALGPDESGIVYGRYDGTVDLLKGLLFDVRAKR